MDKFSVMAVVAIGLAFPAFAQTGARTGRTVYVENCVLCHGDDGGGSTTPGYDGSALLDNTFIKSHSDAELLVFLKVGRAPDAKDSQMQLPMPGFGTLPETDLKMLVDYLRELSKRR